MIPRRDFLKVAAAGIASGTFSEARGSMAVPVVIEAPYHGALLNHRHGKQVDDGLQVRISGQAALNDNVTVNGVTARRQGARFSADILLRDKETDLTASAFGVAGRSEHTIRVLWDRGSRPRYRFSIDDNSFFLRDITKKHYKSLFDCFYLDMLRQLHTKYGTRFVLNIYYQTEDGFTLPQFPDRYRGEWEAASDWLKLAFHAWANKPDRPYQYASAGKLISDLDKVAEQIKRFAGPQTYSPPTVIHWGMVQPAALKPLAQRGVRVLSGYFKKRGGLWDVNYFLDDARCNYLARHDALKDFDSGIVFSTIYIVCNNTPVEQVVPTLTRLAKTPDTAEIMDLFTHEQYFWPFYSNYIPDHLQRCEAAIRWVTENGYEPVFYHEGLLGNCV